MLSTFELISILLLPPHCPIRPPSVFSVDPSVYTASSQCLPFLSRFCYVLSQFMKCSSLFYFMNIDVNDVSFTYYHAFSN